MTSKGTRTAKRRILANGVYCACGCGKFISEFKPCGLPRYSRSKDGKFYISGHNPLPIRENHHNWKGGKIIDSNGYIMILKPDHPNCDRYGYVKEHRFIWEQANKRLLNRNEHIHHINGIRSDNRLENLIMLTSKVHAKLTYLSTNGIPSTREQKQAAGRKGAKARWG